MGTFVVGAQKKSHPLRMLAFVFIVLIMSLWGRLYFSTHEVKNDPTTQPDLDAAKQAAQPLLDELENYRAINGLYPPTLDQFDPASRHRNKNARGYLYSARRNDWVFKSDACPTREKSLQGWIMKPTGEYQKEVAQFKSDCIAGYHEFQLQSPDFPDPSSNDSPGNDSLERWAYYDSLTKQWSVGWCSHDQGVTGKGSISLSAANGVCR
jgi:hypothetical protein